MTVDTGSVLARSVVVIDHLLAAIVSIILLAPLIYFSWDTFGVLFWVIAPSVAVLVDFSYFAVQEALQGQTVMKRAANLRVVSQDGSQVSVRQAVVRNLVRYIDFLPACYLIGAGMSVASPYRRRVGDYAAGTAVVYGSEGDGSYDIGREDKSLSLRLVGWILVGLGAVPAVGLLVRFAVWLF